MKTVLYLFVLVNIEKVLLWHGDWFLTSEQLIGTQQHGIKNVKYVNLPFKVKSSLVVILKQLSDCPQEELPSC